MGTERKGGYGIRSRGINGWGKKHGFYEARRCKRSSRPYDDLCHYESKRRFRTGNS